MLTSQPRCEIWFNFEEANFKRWLYGYMAIWPISKDGFAAISATADPCVKTLIQWTYYIVNLIIIH